MCADHAKACASKARGDQLRPGGRLLLVLADVMLGGMIRAPPLPASLVSPLDEYPVCEENGLPVHN